MCAEAGGGGGFSSDSYGSDYTVLWNNGSNLLLAVRVQYGTVQSE